MSTQLLLRSFVLALAATCAVPELAGAIETAHAQDDRVQSRSRRNSRARRRARASEARTEAAPTPEATSPESTDAAPRSNVIEFDERVIRGESAGSGAVMLLDRRQRNLVPLIRRRTSFVDATVRPVLGPEAEVDRPEPVRAANERSER